MSTPPLPEGLKDDRRSNIANRLHSAAIHLLRHVRTADADSGLTPARLAALSVLVFGGAKTISQLAEIEIVSVPAITRLVNALESAGLVERQPGADRRTVIVNATESARRLMEGARLRRLQKFRELLGPFSEGETKVVEEAVGLLERELAKVRR